MRVICLLDGANGVSFHRLYTPYLRLQQDHDITVDVSLNHEDWLNLDYQQYDCVIFNRWLGRYQYNILPLLAKYKVPYIVDLDDYWVLPKYNPAYKFYRAYIKDGVKNALTYADGVQVTTPQLAEKIKEFYKGDNITIAENAVDFTQAQWNVNKDHTPTIGWVGGISHVEDIKLLTNQIRPICEKYGYRFIMGGHHENSRMWAEMEKAITGESQKNRPSWFETRVGTTPDKYAEIYSEIDICLAPLTAQTFNRYKSELKIVEAAAYKRPILVSSVEPYTNHKSNLGVFFVQNNDWTTPLTQLIQSGKSKEVGLINYNYCNENHNIQEINKKRIDLLQKVCRP
jgi:glycosyltransferase involved in cell wall biosynthesis